MCFANSAVWRTGRALRLPSYAPKVLLSMRWWGLPKPQTLRSFMKKSPAIMPLWGHPRHSNF
eukprot:3096640-Pyramimonas_sp.AAC.1